MYTSLFFSLTFLILSLGLTFRAFRKLAYRGR